MVLNIRRRIIGDAARGVEHLGVAADGPQLARPLAGSALQAVRHGPFDLRTQPVTLI